MIDKPGEFALSVVYMVEKVSELLDKLALIKGLPEDLWLVEHDAIRATHEVRRKLFTQCSVCKIWKRNEFVIENICRVCKKES
jgi:hypothetical protein